LGIVIYLGSSPLFVDMSTLDEITQVSVDHLSTDRDDQIESVRSDGEVILDVVEDVCFGGGDIGHGDDEKNEGFTVYSKL